VEKIAFMGDVHIPFQDNRAVMLSLEFLRWFQPHYLYLIGDIVDFYAVSRYDKDPDRILGLQDELDEAMGLLDRYRTAVGPETKIIFREGNHEHRLTKYLRNQPEIAKLRTLRLPALLEFKNWNIHYSPYSRHLDHRGFLVEHGDIVRKHSGYTARGMLERRGVSGITGHTHRLGAHYATDHGGIKMWFENGCLCSLKPEYMLGTPNWQHGFSVAHALKGDNRLHVSQVPIMKDRVFYNDHIFQ
jgi:hypothetical protein